MPVQAVMRKVNLNEIKEEPWQSPGGKYAVSFKGISEALGRDPTSLDLAKRHPFDLEWNRVPPGKFNFPTTRTRHNGSFIWSFPAKEAFVTEMARLNSSLAMLSSLALTNPIRLLNAGREDLVYYVIADNPIGESAYLPDSGKWKVNKSSAADRVVVKGNETDWFDGEE